jgi:hypothetical protein
MYVYFAHEGVVKLFTILLLMYSLVRTFNGTPHSAARIAVRTNLFINRCNILKGHNIIEFESPCYKTTSYFVLNAGCTIRGSQKVPGIISISTVWCTMSLFRLVRVLLVICTCKFCTGCAMQFGRSGARSDSHCGFCITIMYQATHRLLYSNSSPRRAFISSSNDHTLGISLRASFCSFLL